MGILSQMVTSPQGYLRNPSWLGMGFGFLHLGHKFLKAIQGLGGAFLHVRLQHAIAICFGELVLFGACLLIICGSPHIF